MLAAADSAEEALVKECLSVAELAAAVDVAAEDLAGQGAVVAVVVLAAAAVVVAVGQHLLVVNNFLELPKSVE